VRAHGFVGVAHFAATVTTWGRRRVVPVSTPRVFIRRRPLKVHAKAAKAGRFCRRRKRRPLDVGARGAGDEPHILAALAGGAPRRHRQQRSGRRFCLPTAWRRRPSMRIGDFSSRGARDGRACRSSTSYAKTLPAVRIVGFRGRREQHDQLHSHRDGTGGDGSGRRSPRCRPRGVAEADASPRRRWLGRRGQRRRRSPTSLPRREHITPKDVKRRGIGPDTGRLGTRGRARRPAGGVKLGRGVADRDGPTRLSRRPSHQKELRGDDLLAGLGRATEMPLILKTDLLAEIAIVQRSGSLTPDRLPRCLSDPDRHRARRQERVRPSRRSPATKRGVDDNHPSPWRHFDGITISRSDTRTVGTVLARCCSPTWARGRHQGRNSRAKEDDNTRRLGTAVFSTPRRAKASRCRRRGWKRREARIS